jgi:DNA-binding response OmpR family regulator
MAKVCIIEDDPAFSAALERVISKSHTVYCFTNTPEDLDDILSLEPNLILLDCMLPGETGPNFLHRLRADDRGQTTPIVLMSAYHEVVEESKQVVDRYQEFLKKPCTIRQVLDVVHRHVGGLQPISEWSVV